MYVPIRFVSSITGEVPESVHYFIDDDDYDALIKRYSKAVGIRRYVVPAILKAEYEFGGEEVGGKKIYDCLIDFGFSESIALSVTKVFFANEDVIDRLLAKENDKSIIYDHEHTERMRMCGLDYLRYMKRYVLTSDVYVYPIHTEYEWIEPPEPPIVIREYWRNFEVSMLMDCTTRTKKGDTEHRKVEFRGIFKAEKNNIIDWELYHKGMGQTEAHVIVKVAVEVAESVLKEYYEIKGYDFMSSCDGPSYNGLDVLDKTDDIIVYELDAESEVSKIVLEVIDIDYGNVKRFTDEFQLVGRWWQDKSYTIKELRTQVSGAYRW